MLEESTLNYHIALWWRLRSGCPWRFRKEQLILKCQSSTDIFFLLVILTSILSNNRQTNKEFVKNWLWRFFFNSQEMNRSILFSLYLLRISRRWVTFFETSHVEREPIHFHSFIGMMLGNSIDSLFCDFPSVFDLTAKSFTLDYDACSSNRSARISVLL